MGASEPEAAATPPRPGLAAWSGLSAIHLLLIASGAAGLGYQIVWTRMLSIGLGHEIFAMLAVVAAFFAGLGLGALAFDARIARSRRPGLWYAGLEALIGAWTLALIWLIPIVNAQVAGWIGPEPGELRRWAASFLAPALVLAPATVAMGATLPAAERLYARLRRDGRGVGGLYAANTAGAMIGALATAVWLAPTLGFTATLIVFSALNFACAAGALFGPARGEAARAPLAGAAAGVGPSAGILAALFLTGLLGVGYEVAVVRALSQLLENTIYSFAAALSVYLLGAALGAAAYQRVYAAQRRPGWDAPALGALIALTAAAAALGAAAIFAVPSVYAAVAPMFGAGQGAIGAELLAAAMVFGPVSAAMGALFAHLAQGARGPEGGLGAAVAANTFGAACAPLLIGVAAIPALGVAATLAAFALAYLALGLALGARPRGARAALWAAPAALALVLLAGPIDRRLVSPPPGGAIRAHVEGVAAAATVTEDAPGNRYLRVNGDFVMGGTATYTLDRIQGHAALLTHPRPRRALFLGVGTGATLAAAAAHPDLEAVGVELLDEVLALTPEFDAARRDIEAAGGRVRLLAADARRYARAAEGVYDVILSDNFHPAKDGAGLLYTREHFQAVRARLSADGVFVQWLPLHQLDLATLRLILRTFLDVFPDGRMTLGNANLGTPLLALYGSVAGGPPDLAALAKRPMPERLARELSAIGLDTPFALFGQFLAGPDELRAYAGAGPLNTDDHPLVLFEAPRSTIYAPLAAPSERLLALLDAFDPTPAEAVDADGLSAGGLRTDFPERLRAYWRARDAFIRLGASAPLTGDVNQDARALAPRLIEIVAMSPDYAPAYTPVLRMAQALARTEPGFAARLLDQLAAANPARLEARRLRARIRPPRAVDRRRALEARPE